MRIIARRTLRVFVASLAGHKDRLAVKAALDAWFDELKKARWKSTAEVRRSYATAGVLSAERAVFNVKGNAYRLVVAVDFEKGIVWIKWIGTHKAYDRIDVTEVERGEGAEANPQQGRLPAGPRRSRAALGREERHASGRPS